MSRESDTPVPIMRGAAELADAADLRSAVAASLGATPIDERALRRDVWTLVETEREAGASPADIIATLTDLVDEAKLVPRSVQKARMRQVVLWYVEAYFGRLGGDVLTRDAEVGAGRGHS